MLKNVTISIFLVLNICFCWSQNNSESKIINRWEIGVNSYMSFLFYKYENVPQGHLPPVKEWVIAKPGLIEDKHIFGIYCNYVLFKFLSSSIAIDINNYNRGVHESYKLHYNNNEADLIILSYNLKSVEIPTRIELSAFNNTFVNPYITLGIHNSLIYFEKVLVVDGFPKYFTSRNMNYYALRGILGVGLNFCIKKRIDIGADANLFTRPVWQTKKVLEPDLKYSTISLRFYLAYRIPK